MTMSNPPSASFRAKASASVFVSRGISRIDGATVAWPPYFVISFAISGPRRLSSESTRRPLKFVLDSTFSISMMMPQLRDMRYSENELEAPVPRFAEDLAGGPALPRGIGKTAGETPAARRISGKFVAHEGNHEEIECVEGASRKRRGHRTQLARTPTSPPGSRIRNLLGPGVVSKGDVVRLRACGDYEGACHDNNRDDSSHRLTVCEVARCHSLDEGRRRCDQHSNLIGKTRQQGAHRIRYKLINVRRDHAPRRLYHELHQECPRRNQRDSMGENPKRDQQECAPLRRYHGAAAGKTVREKPAQSASQNRAQHRDHPDHGRQTRREVYLLQEKRRVEVLRAMREETHHGHQQREIQETLSIGGNRAEIGSPVFLHSRCCLPRLAFLDSGQQQHGQQCRHYAQEEHGAPTPMGKNQPEGHAREQIADGIALLQDS